MIELMHKEVTGKIIGSYYQAYNRLGNTYPERIYENAIAGIYTPGFDGIILV